MKTSIGTRIITMFFIPFILIFAVLFGFIFMMISSFIEEWVEDELTGISQINAIDLAGHVESVRVNVMSSAELIATIDNKAENARERAERVLSSLFVNEMVYNTWVVFEPQAYDGRDGDYTEDYPGAPSGRFMRSFLQEENGEIITAPDMHEDWIDDPEEAPWYTIPVQTGELYIDIDSEANIWDYGVEGRSSVYTLTLVAPIIRDGVIIGCVGADVSFDDMVTGIGGGYNTHVAVFYSNGKIFYSPDIDYAEESIYTLGFNNIEDIENIFEEEKSMMMPDEFCIFCGERSYVMFHPIEIRNYNAGSLFLYASTPRSVLYDRLLPVLGVVGAAVAVVTGIMFVLLLYVVRRVSLPLRQLTQAADAISQGDIETEIGYFSDSDIEIGVLSQSLHRMVEQFRVHATEMEKTQLQTEMRFKIDEIISRRMPMTETFGRLVSISREQTGVSSSTFVHISAGRPLAYSRTNMYNYETECRDFEHHAQVENLITDKRIVFFNANAIRANGIEFLRPQTCSAVFIPLRKDTLLGYVILENDDKVPMSAVNEEIMLYAAEILSEWLFMKELERHVEDELTDYMPTDDENSFDETDKEFLIDSGQPANEEKPAEPELSLFDRLRGIKNIDIERALEAVGGLEDVYIQTVKLTLRLMPETVDKLDTFLSLDEFKAFTTEVHGIKGVLRNMGASHLGNMAADLETQGQDRNAKGLAAGYPLFRKEMLTFMDELNEVFTHEKQEEKTEGDPGRLADAVSRTKVALEMYDANDARDIFTQFRDVTFNGFNADMDDLIREVIFALEEFNCEGALINIIKLEELLQ